MSQKTGFEDFKLPWQNDIFSKSEKNMNFTMSDMSKSQFGSRLFPEEELPDNQWNLDEFNKKAERKMKNRNNAKTFRMRKKLEKQTIDQRIEQLEQENKILKMEKYCRYCHRSFEPTIQVETISHVTEKQPSKHMCIHSKEQENFEFQKVNFYDQKKSLNSKEHRNGKIWIALGILMLVIGIHIHGFNGKEDYSSIEITNLKSSRQWIESFENRAKAADRYLNVKLHNKSKQLQSQQNEEAIFKEIKVVNSIEKSKIGQQNNQRSSQRAETVNILGRLEMVQEEDEAFDNIRLNNHSETLDERQQSQSSFKFNKEFLYAIQAEIDEVGNYF